MSGLSAGCEGGGRVRWLRDTDGDGTLDQWPGVCQRFELPKFCYTMARWRDHRDFTQHFLRSRSRWRWRRGSARELLEASLRPIRNIAPAALK